MKIYSSNKPDNCLSCVRLEGAIVLAICQSFSRMEGRVLRFKGQFIKKDACLQPTTLFLRD